MTESISTVPAAAGDSNTIATWLNNLQTVQASIASQGRLLRRGSIPRFFKRIGRFLARVDYATGLVAGFGFNYCAFSTTDVPWWNSSTP
jgi:hypothetical protein